MDDDCRLGGQVRQRQAEGRRPLRGASTRGGALSGGALSGGALSGGALSGYPEPADPGDAERIQAELRSRLDLTNVVDPSQHLLAAGLDVSYEVGSQRVAAAVAVVHTGTLAVVETAVVHGEATFPYVPGLLAFREVPILLEAFGKIEAGPDVLVCDGYGIAHPRRFGLACHVGVLTGLPSFGVAKTPFTATYPEPGRRRGDWSPLTEGDELLGRALRTQTDVKPVFVSVGHRIGLAQATTLTLRLSSRFRLPETTRAADSLSRQALR